MHRLCHVTMVCGYCLSQDGLVALLELCSSEGGGARVGGCCRSFWCRRGLGQLLPDVPSLPSPSRRSVVGGGVHVYDSCVATKPQTPTEEHGAVHCLVVCVPLDKSSLHSVISQPRSMFGPVLRISAALF